MKRQAHGDDNDWQPRRTGLANLSGIRHISLVRRMWYYSYPSAAWDISALLGMAGFGRGTRPKKKKREPGLPGYMVTSPAPGAVRVQYYAPPRVSDACRGEMLAAYASAVTAAGYALAADCGDDELVIPRQRRLKEISKQGAGIALETPARPGRSSGERPEGRRDARLHLPLGRTRRVRGDRPGRTPRPPRR
jgi:hypothetical protein